MSNKYYDWWKENKPFLSLIPAVVFWAVSMVFFMVGLKFNNPIIVFGKDASVVIAVSLSISNTIIQIIGNEQEQESMGVALWMGWMASYALGIGTNVVGLLTVLSIDNVYLEWIIAMGLGTMIEVLPERLLVQFLKGFQGKSKKPYRPQPQQAPYRPNPQKPTPKPVQKPQNPYREPTYHPVGMSGDDKLKKSPWG